MTDQQATAVMEYATRFVGMKPDGKLRQFMILHGAGLSPQAIARQFGNTDNAIRMYLSRGWRRIASHHWTEWEKRELTEVANRILCPELAERTSCAQIVDAARGLRRYRDQAPEVDENGRDVATRPPIVNADDLMRWLIYKSRREAMNDPVRRLF